MRRHATGAATIAPAPGLAIQVRAGADKWPSRKDCARGVKYLVVDMPTKQVQEFYASPAIGAARKGAPCRTARS